MAGKNKDRWESHEAKGLGEAVKLATTGDVGAAVVYLCAHRKDIRHFCKQLKEEAPSKCLTVFRDILTLLMNDAGAEDEPLKIEGQAPADFQAAKEAALEGNTAALAAFLKTHPDQIGPFCNAVLGSFSGMRMAIGLALRAITTKTERDYFDVMAELLTFLIEHNHENVSRVRSRIAVVFAATEGAELDEGWAEDATQNGEFRLNGQPVHTRLQFIPGDENGPRAQQFLQDLAYAEEGADEEALHRLARPLIEAGIDIQFVAANREAGTPGYFCVPKEALNEALEAGKLQVRRQEHENLKFDLVTSPKLRAAARGMRVVQ